MLKAEEHRGVYEERLKLSADEVSNTVMFCSRAICTDNIQIIKLRGLYEKELKQKRLLNQREAKLVTDFESEQQILKNKLRIMQNDMEALRDTRDEFKQLVTVSIYMCYILIILLSFRVWQTCW